MIVTDHFVFLHLHKSGGTFVNQLLLNCIPSAKQIGYHLPYAVLPDDHRGLRVLGTVRNPWAYYVSWYHFQRGQARPNSLFSICSHGGTLSFEPTISNLVMLHDDPERLAELSRSLPRHFGKAGLNLTQRCLTPLAGSGLGFYSFLYQRLYAGAAAPTILPAERLRQTLRETLAAWTGGADARTELFLDSVPDLNRSEHGAYADYYGADLRRLVACHDADIIARHGYRF